MDANNWDIKIINKETQTALYIREYHQIALSIIFSHLPLMCMGLHDVSFRYNCQKISDQIVII